ncbi:FAST kinase domain-containing protein 5, mitochondrial [Python bivittatus]|uniref:FAST kinase domain-containing protein 5, mitochondrial n=1 Tax=Python bivittatus TaxID=176946 RepID=A0A9F2R196_PYTBI|nr:FAST kinase domain-containing protein 5, mitochondrial [Python bivittatus]XP_007432825.1 FAST kinase domain-containing protein 5, mitochondrial [Python bivittatus]
MSTGIICRRFSGRSCRTTAFSTATKAETTEIFPKGEEGHRTKRGGRDFKPAVAPKLWKPPGYRLCYYPSTSLETKCLLHKDAPKGLTEGSLEYVCSRTSIKCTQNTHSVPCPPMLPRIKSMLLDLENSKAFCTQASLREPLLLSPIKNDREDVYLETYGSKEAARQFQKQRPEYKSLCYIQDECLQPLSVEECHLILQKVSVLKERMKPEAVANSFFRLSHLPAEKHQTIKSSAKFAVLCQNVVNSIHLFENSELIVLLKAFVSLAIPPIHQMLKVVETECCRRVGHLSLDQQLLVADLWRCLNCKVPQYLDVMLNYINMNWNDLSLTQLVQLVYIVGEGRKAHEDLMKKLEASVAKHLDSLNLEEVGIICLGFFKTQSPISEPIMRKIGDKICDCLGDMSSFAIVNVLKMFRGVHIDHVDFLKQLGHVIPPRISTISIQGVMHIAFACSSLHYCNENIMNAVAAAVPPKAASCRTKDIAKLLWSFGNMNYEPPNAEEFYASLREQLESRLFEYNKFPEHLITSLIGLAFVKQFPYDLLDYALSPEFIKLSSISKYDLWKDFFTLDGTVEIECPSYTGSRLSTQNKQEMAEKMQNYSLKQEFAVAWSLLEDMLGGSQYVKLHAILPHTRSVDLEIRLDSNQKPLPFNSKGATAGRSELKKNGTFLTDNIINQLLKGKSVSQPIPSDGKSKKDVHIQKRAGSRELPIWNNLEFSDRILLAGPSLNTSVNAKAEGLPSMIDQEQQRCVKLALQVTNRNQYRYHSRELLGLHSMKRRQLRQIGYIPVELPFWEWFPLLRCSHVEQLTYLCQKVYER